MTRPDADVNPVVDSSAAQAQGRRAVFAAVALTAFDLRTAVTGFSVLLGIVSADLGFGPIVAGAVGTVITACFALSAFAAPGIARRVGVERALALATAAATIGIALRAVSFSAASLLITTVVAFVGIGTANVLLVPAIREHYPNRIQSMSTLYLVALQVGQLLAPLLAPPLAALAGWRIAAGVWVLLLAPASVFWAIAARGHPGRPEPRTRPKGTFGRPGLAVAGLIGLMAMTALHTYTLVTWLPTMFQQAGLPLAGGGALLSLFAGVGLIAAFVVPRLTTGVANPYGIVLSCVALLAVGYGGMLIAPAGGAILWAVCLGLGVSTFPLTLTLIAARAANSGEASRLSGLVQGIGYGVGCIGPIVLGVLDQATGTWTGAYWALIGTLAVTAVSGWFACRPRQPPRETD